MAKKKRKPRTPAPPRSASREAGASRPVQAPQVRKKQKQRDPAARERTKRYALYGAGGMLAVGAAVAVIAIFALGSSSSSAAPNVDFAKLPGINHGKAPWPAEIDNLAQRLPPLGLKPLPREALNEHIHQHLDIYINGKHVGVPRFVGIDDSQFITELHTHLTDGIIHVESEKKKPYSLGQFFGVWGLFLSKRCIGGYCATPNSPLFVYVDGSRYQGDPVNLVLQPHQEIAIVYGKPPKHIPQKYKFPPGY